MCTLGMTYAAGHGHESERSAEVLKSSAAELIRRRLDQRTPSERKPVRLLPGTYRVVGLEPLAGFARRGEQTTRVLLL